MWFSKNITAEEEEKRRRKRRRRRRRRRRRGKRRGRRSRNETKQTPCPEFKDMLNPQELKVVALNI